MNLHLTRNKLLINRSSLHEKINYVSLLLIGFTLPFHIMACSYATAIFVINQLAEGNLISKFKTAINNKFVITFIAFFFLHLIGLFFTQNINNGLFDIEKKASLLIFPLLLCSVKVKREYIIHILLSFIIACFLLTLVLLSNATYNYIHTGTAESFILDNLTSATEIHRVYLSMYLLFCIYILIFIQYKNFIKFKYATLYFNILIIYFTIFIFLLASRNIVLLTVISFVFVTIHNTIKTKKIIRGVLFLSMFFIMAGGFLLYNQPVRTIIFNTFEDLDKGNSDYNHTGPNLRVEIWKSSIGVIKDNIWGVGTGDTEDELHKSYVANNFKWGIQERFNAHNQYLQTMLGLGIIGLALLLLCLFWPTFFAFANKHYFYLGFVLLFTSTCLTESMLCAQKGIVFYTFFNSLLVFHYPKEK